MNYDDWKLASPDSCQLCDDECDRLDNLDDLTLIALVKNGSPLLYAEILDYIRGRLKDKVACDTHYEAHT